MAETRREKVLAAVKTALEGMSGVNVYRNRAADVLPGEMPAVVQLDGGHEVVPRNTGETPYTLEFTVQGYATAADDDALTAAVDGLYGEVVAALVADPTLGGIASDVREVAMSAPEFLREDQEAPFAAFAVDFEVDFETAETSPYDTP